MLWAGWDDDADIHENSDCPQHAMSWLDAGKTLKENYLSKIWSTQPGHSWVTFPVSGTTCAPSVCESHPSGAPSPLSPSLHPTAIKRRYSLICRQISDMGVCSPTKHFQGAVIQSIIDLIWSPLFQFLHFFSRKFNLIKFDSLKKHSGFIFTRDDYGLISLNRGFVLGRLLRLLKPPGQFAGSSFLSASSQEQILTWSFISVLYLWKKEVLV